MTIFHKESAASQLWISWEAALNFLFMLILVHRLFCLMQKHSTKSHDNKKHNQIGDRSNTVGKPGGSDHKDTACKGYAWHKDPVEKFKLLPFYHEHNKNRDVKGINCDNG